MNGRPGEYPAAAAAVLRERPGVRHAVTRATTHFHANREAAFAEVDAVRLRDWARDVKSHALTHLDDLLLEAEARLTERGARVHWAEGPADVHRVLGTIVEAREVRSAVKGKSMLSEEVGVNGFLEGRGVEVRETDLGEFVIQLLGEPPSHIVGPAIHRGLEEIRELFHARLGTPRDGSPDVLARAARALLREAFLAAELGISGGNFLVAETGTVALIENEGNIRLATSVPPVHVALVGIEKVLPRWGDLAPFLQLTSRSATGQPVGTFVSAIQGPDPEEGPEELHVILVDNGRSDLLGDPVVWEALRCVRCGACLNVCPVFRQTGGHPYGWVYSGPIGSVLAPAFLGLDEGMELPFASSLCGACGDVCPVRIPLPELLLEWRRRAVDTGLTPAADGWLHAAWAGAATRPRVWGAGARAVRHLPVLRSRSLPWIGAWNEHRAPPRAEGATFLEGWDLAAGRTGSDDGVDGGS